MFIEFHWSLQLGLELNGVIKTENTEKLRMSTFLLFEERAVHFGYKITTGFQEDDIN